MKCLQLKIHAIQDYVKARFYNGANIDEKHTSILLCVYLCLETKLLLMCCTKVIYLYTYLWLLKTNI